MKTHYMKTVDKDWIGTYILPTNEKGDYMPINIKLLCVKFEEVKVKGKKEPHNVAYFDKNPHFDKPMLLNKTNLARLHTITGTPYIEDWVNLNITVTLQAEWDKCFGGGKDWALRINPKLPVLKLPALTPSHEKWEGAKKALAAGNVTIEKIKTQFTLTEENEKLLCLKSDAAK